MCVSGFPVHCQYTVACRVANGQAFHMSNESSLDSSAVLAENKTAVVHKLALGVKYVTDCHSVACQAGCYRWVTEGTTFVCKVIRLLIPRLILNMSAKGAESSQSDQYLVTKCAA